MPQIGLFAEAVVAIDGTKFKAVNTRDRNFTPAKMKKRHGARSRRAIAGYLAEMDTADRQEAEAERRKSSTRAEDRLASRAHGRR